MLLALPGELLFYRPRPRPHGRIFDGDLVFECGGGAPRPAFDHVQIVARALKISLRTEIRHVDHERIAFPMAARVALPLTYVRRQVWTSVHHDVALPPLALAHIVEERDATWRLHDPAEAADPASKLWQPGGQATLGQRTVLGAIIAIHTPGIVARRRFRSAIPSFFEIKEAGGVHTLSEKNRIVGF